MTQYICPMHQDVRQEQSGHCPECGMALVAAKEEKFSEESQSAYYTCPMHEDVLEEQEGHCPECGMALVATDRRPKKHDEHDAHEGHGGGNPFKVRFWVSLLLTIPVLLYADILQELFGYTAPAFLGSDYIGFIFGSVIFFYGGKIFLTSAAAEIRGRAPGMMTLIAIAIGSAYIWSVFTTFAGVEGALYWELASLITIMLLGHWMEMRSVQGAQGALKELSKLLPDTAEVIRDGHPVSVSLSELQSGDAVLVRPGGRVPADGIVLEGRSDVNESMITGESKPVEKEEGSEVVGGTVNGEGALTVKIEKIGEDTFLAGVMRLVKEAQQSKSKMQTVADRAARWLTYTALSVAVLTLFGWFIVAQAPFGVAIERVVAVLVIACPHALGLAVPLVVAISTTMGASGGLLVRDRIALERARNVDVVLFDKTGTLTEGRYGVADIFSAEESQKEAVLSLAAGVDARSEHPVARAIVEHAKQQKTAIPKAQDFSAIAGKGARGRIGENTVHVGGTGILEFAKGDISDALKQQVDKAKGEGKTVVYVLEGGSVLGALSLADVIRVESREAIRQLQDSGIRVAMVTGDAQGVANWVAEELGLDEVFAEVRPDQKAEKVKELQRGDRQVAMVGDGVNDAPALVQADVGIAIGAGTNVAVESAGIILVRNDPRDIVRILRLSKLTYTKMVQNLFWAAGYNVVAIPLAAGVLAAWGILLEPAFAALLMSLSTVIVAANALLMRRTSLDTAA